MLYGKNAAQYFAGAQSTCVIRKAHRYGRCYWSGYRVFAMNVSDCKKKKKTSKILPVTLTKKTFCGAKVSGFWTTNGNCLNALIIQQCLEEGSFRKGFQRKVLSNHNYRSVSKLCSEGIQAMGNWAVSEFPWCPLLFFVTSSHGFWSVF